MAATNSTKLMEWTDPPEPGRSADDWPYPTTHVKYLISGELADRVRAKLGQPAETPVVMTEDQESGGYSEYTQETDYSHTIDCGPHTIQLGSAYWGLSWGSTYGSNGLTNLLKWLDSADEGL
jgi:hypothetical protein